MGWAAAVSAGFSVLQGVAGAKAASVTAQNEVDEAAYTRRQAEGAAQDERIAADQEEIIRRRELNSTLSTIDAIRASRGMSLNSPSALNYNKVVGRNAYDNIRVEKLNRLTKAGSFSQQAAFATRQMNSASKAGRIGVYASLLKGVAGAASSLNSAGIFDRYQPGISPTQRLSNGDTIYWRK